MASRKLSYNEGDSEEAHLMDSRIGPWWTTVDPRWGATTVGFMRVGQDEGKRRQNRERGSPNERE